MGNKSGEEKVALGWGTEKRDFMYMDALSSLDEPESRDHVPKILRGRGHGVR